MAFNGAGLFTQLHNWVTDKTNSILVTASRFQATYDDMATALSNCITRDGQSPPTANIPMGSFKITGLATGVASTDAVNVGQVAALAGAAVFYNAGNSAAAITIDPVNGQHQQFTLTNNATVTLGSGLVIGWHTLRILQDATGGRSITWAGAGYSATRWMGNQTAPVLSTVASSVETLQLFWDGSTWSQRRMQTNQRRWVYPIIANSAGQTVNASTTADLAFTDENVDPYSEFSSATFTAKVAGLYRVEAFVTALSGTGSDGEVSLLVLIAGDSNQLIRYVQTPIGQAFDLSIGYVGVMAAGDTAKITITNSMAAAIAVQTSSYIVVTRLGDAQ